MTAKISSELGNVQKTLFLPLWGRAVESQKSNPLLVDKTAVEIIARLDYDFSVIAGNVHEITQRAWVVRSILVDNVINGFLRRHPDATVVNIGCGLDTTFDRVDNGTVRWYDLDLPDVITLRRNFIPERERRTYIASSFLDDAWFHNVKAGDHVLFIGAGVFYYSEREQVKDFFHRVADAFPGSEIVFDVCSTEGVKIANKEVIKKSGLDEKSFLLWGIDNSQQLLSWDSRIKILNECSYFRNRKKGLTLKGKIMAFFSDHLKVQWLIHMKFVNVI